MGISGLFIKKKSHISISTEVAGFTVQPATSEQKKLKDSSCEPTMCTEAMLTVCSLLQFRRATVQNYKTGELEIASYRISKSSWLKAEDSEVVWTVNERVAAITGNIVLLLPLTE